MTLPAFVQAGRNAVITGGADGVGRAAAIRLSALGMNVLLADRRAEALEATAAEVRAAAPSVRVESAVVDVADFVQVAALADRAFADFGDIAVLMNNAGVGGGGHAFENRDGWSRVLSVNLFGVINGVQAFAPRMAGQRSPSAIVNTGSKQGITTPPGDTAYNVSKAGVKALTEGLEHTLRNTPGCLAHAYLLVPGFTFTGMTRRRISEKPPGAWTADQVIEFALARMAAGDFYILCPDNEVTREVDNARIEWAAHDLIDNRPPLSRWHDDWKDRFAAFMAQRVPSKG